MDIGVVGIGPMGGAMVRSLLRAGHRVTVFNRTREKAEALRGDGAMVAAMAAEAAAREAVITMLATDDAVEGLVFGADGVLAGLPKGAIHISGSTISVDLSQRLEEAHAGLGQGLLPRRFWVARRRLKPESSSSWRPESQSSSSASSPCWRRSASGCSSLATGRSRRIW